MAKSKEREAQLKKNIENNTALKSKYERVRKSIESHNLHFSNEFIHINAFIEIAKDTLNKIDGNDGYHYLSNFREKLETEIKTLENTVITSNNRQVRLNVCMRLWKLILPRSIFLLIMIKMN